jgi:hypothetical protein
MASNLPVTRGRLRVYLGYAPGSGATCALLARATSAQIAAMTWWWRVSRHTAGRTPKPRNNLNLNEGLWHEVTTLR